LKTASRGRARMPIEITGAALISRAVERDELLLSTVLQPGDQS
jgi:hypothetical protein